MTTFFKISRLLVGLVFLLSALLKAIDTAAFANLMSQYGASWFGYAAPLIILTEAILGLLLVFGYKPQLTTIIASAFILVVSLIYLYGVLFQDIKDCGCFGPLTWLNTKSWLTFLRNGLLLALLLPSLCKPQEDVPFTIPAIAFMALVAVVIMFMCGYSFRGAKCLQKKEVAFQPIAVMDSPLASHITTQSDSSYLVFAFSYNCPYCMNAIGNVNQYTQMHAVDRVIGLAVNDTALEARFHRLFETNFEIHNISPFAMYQIAHTLPMAFLIRRDSIVRRYDGMVISPALFMK